MNRKKAKEGASSGPIRLLLVDDSPADLRLLVQMLSREDYKITVALNGRQAYERALSESRPDLIVLDVSMPVLSGYGACTLLKRNPVTAQIPIIFVTASSALKDRLVGFRLGGADYVSKPYNAAELIARIRAHLGRTGRSLATLDGPREGADTSAPWDRGTVHEEFGLSNSAPVGPASTRERLIVEASVRYLSERLNSPPSRKQLARQMGVNEKRINLAFREHLGVSVTDFVRNERITRAKAMLADSALSIAEIGECLGFSSAANFASAFRRQIGYPPGQFRRHAATRTVHPTVPTSFSGQIEKQQ